MILKFDIHPDQIIRLLMPCLAFHPPSNWLIFQFRLFNVKVFKREVDLDPNLHNLIHQLHDDEFRVCFGNRNRIGL